MNPLDNKIQQHVDQLLHELDISDLYKLYKWKEDTWERGFPDLFRLENEISKAARMNSLGLVHLQEIAKWGGLRNKKIISCPEPIRVTLYVNDLPASGLETEPETAISELERQIRGFGPTYTSKLLHFAVPQACGAIDTRLVRTFGEGDPDSQRYPLLNLMVETSGERWAIPSLQPGWPGEYGTWVSILCAIAHNLNKNGIKCPHPSKYVQSGLREAGIWLPADVETALFSYASQGISGKKSGNLK